MSKMDALRALREARYEEEAKRGRQAGETPKRAQRAAAVRPAEAKPSTVDAPPADSGLCGHKSMNGRTCTRESGHTAKSHRYS
jgi:hypothetical protein